MRKKVHYKKLVRDRIPQIIKKRGGGYKIKQLNTVDFEHELLKKIPEEAYELAAAQTRDLVIKEIIDITDLLDELKIIHKVRTKELETARKNIHRAKGKFKKRTYLYWSEDTGYEREKKKARELSWHEVQDNFKNKLPKELRT